MKKLILPFLLLCSIQLATPTKSNGQAVMTGSVVVDAYYGFPNLAGILKALYTASGSTFNVNISGIGPMGVRGEYLLSDGFGLGLEGSYVNTSLTYNDSSGFDYSVSRRIIRIFPRFHLHMVRSSEIVDVYGAIGAGYRSVKSSFTSNNPNAIDDNILGINPVVFRLALGFRAFFAGVLGVGMEIGLSGGALIQGGLALRFGYLG